MPTRKIHPLAARIKRVMQSDSDVGKIAQTTPIAISNAVKLLLKELIQGGAQLAESEDSKTLTSSHLFRLVKTKLTELSFLTVLDKAFFPQTVTTVKRKRKSNSNTSNNSNNEGVNEYGHTNKKKKQQKQANQGEEGGIVLPEPPPLENITHSFTKFQQHNNNNSNFIEQSNGDFTQFNYIPLQQFQQSRNLIQKKNSTEISKAFETNLKDSLNQLNNQKLVDRSLMELQEALRNQPINQQLFNNIFAQPPPLVPPLSHPSLPLDFEHFRELNSTQHNLQKDLLNNLLSLNQESAQKSSNISSEQLMLELQQRLFASSQLPQLSEIINSFSELQQKQQFQNMLPIQSVPISNFENFLNFSAPISLQFPSFQNVISQLPTPFAPPSYNMLPLLPVAKPLEIRQSSRIKDENEQQIKTEPLQQPNQVQKMEVEESGYIQNVQKPLLKVQPSENTNSNFKNVQDVLNQATGCCASVHIQPLVAADTINSMVGSSNLIDNKTQAITNTNVDDNLDAKKYVRQPDMLNLKLNLSSTSSQHEKLTTQNQFQPPFTNTTVTTGFDMTNPFQSIPNVDANMIPNFNSSTLQNVYNNSDNINIRESLLKYLCQLPIMAGINLSSTQLMNQQNNLSTSNFGNNSNVNISNISMQLLQPSFPLTTGFDNALILHTLQPNDINNMDSQKINFNQLQTTVPLSTANNLQQEQTIKSPSINSNQRLDFGSGNTVFQSFIGQENTISETISKEQVLFSQLQQQQQQQQQQEPIICSESFQNTQIDVPTNQQTLSKTQFSSEETIQQIKHDSRRLNIYSGIYLDGTKQMPSTQCHLYYQVDGTNQQLSVLTNQQQEQQQQVCQNVNASAEISEMIQQKQSNNNIVQQQQQVQQQDVSVSTGVSQINIGQLTYNRGLVDDTYRDLYQQEDDYDNL